MKKFFKRFISIISIILIVHLLLITFQVRFDHNNVGIEGFYKEEKDSLDVVILGASEVYSDYSPVQAYRDFGFTSYTYAVEDNAFRLYRWQLDEIYRRQSPKLVMIELSSIVPDQDMTVGGDYFDATMRKISDSVPMSSEKLELIKEYGKDPVETYFYPAIKYHGMLPSPSRIMHVLCDMIPFKLRDFSYLKGYVSHTADTKPIRENKLYDLKGDDKQIPLDEEYETILIELLEHCKEKGYHVLFTRFPHRVQSKKRYTQYCQMNYAAQIIRKYGFDFYDFEQTKDEAQIDIYTDYANDSHLVATGSKKFTTLVGKVLTEQYGITESEISEENRHKWDECIPYLDAFYKYYDELKDQGVNMYIHENETTLHRLRELMDHQ